MSLTPTAKQDLLDALCELNACRRHITDLEVESATLLEDVRVLAALLNANAKENRRCVACGSAPHIGTGHANSCRVGKYLHVPAPVAL